MFRAGNDKTFSPTHINLFLSSFNTCPLTSKTREIIQRGFAEGLGERSNVLYCFFSIPLNTSELSTKQKVADSFHFQHANRIAYFWGIDSKHFVFDVAENKNGDGSSICCAA